jgi:hypothetical protein
MRTVDRPFFMEISAFYSEGWIAMEERERNKE